MVATSTDRQTGQKAIGYQNTIEFGYIIRDIDSVEFAAFV